ncbi:hypothetical protein DF18_34415 [Streptomyces rimosus]|nr:hypothetical protein DF18_34415 [Streptomyces rimosus]
MSGCAAGTSASNPGHVVPPGDVAAGQLDVRAEFGEFGDQFRGAGALRAAAREEQQPAGAPACQMPGQRAAQRPEPTGDQYGAVGIGRAGGRAVVALRRTVVAVQPGHQQLARAQRHLGLTGRGRDGDRVAQRGVGRLVDVDQQEATRVLVLCRASQPVGRGQCQVGFVTRTYAERALGADHQQRTGEPLVGEPLSQVSGQLGERGADPCGDVVPCGTGRA